ncbi:MAG: hypothetical protein KF773_14255 [Deltaproteobacteria bacterium]|nr:hypothetical protein [Deltaproteobacteria bacterium]
MSEFSAYLVVQEPAAAVVDRVCARGVSAVVLPTDGAWTIVVCGELDDVLPIPFPSLLSYAYAADHGFQLELFVAGRRAGRLTAASEVGHRWRFEPKPWVEHGVLTAPVAKQLGALLASEQWDHESVRDQVAAVLGFPAESWLSFQYLVHDGDDVLERFPGAVWIERGKRKTVKAPPTAATAAAKVMDALKAPPAGDKKPAKAKAAAATGGKKPERRLAMSNEELRDLSNSFAGAAPVAAPAAKGNAASVDFAQCRTSREWLDAKKLVDPKIASDDVLAELERTIREGRFADEGERAVVVREAAAMLLGRCLASRKMDRAAWLRSRAGTATSPEERATWSIVATVAAVDPASIGLPKR